MGWQQSKIELWFGCRHLPAAFPCSFKFLSSTWRHIPSRLKEALFYHNNVRVDGPTTRLGRQPPGCLSGGSREPCLLSSSISWLEKPSSYPTPLGTNILSRVIANCFELGRWRVVRAELWRSWGMSGWPCSFKSRILFGISILRRANDWTVRRIHTCDKLRCLEIWDYWFLNISELEEIIITTNLSGKSIAITFVLYPAAEDTLA
jgi:hypothetical protein